MAAALPFTIGPGRGESQPPKVIRRDAAKTADGPHVQRRWPLDGGERNAIFRKSRKQPYARVDPVSERGKTLRAGVVRPTHDSLFTMSNSGGRQQRSLAKVRGN